MKITDTFSVIRNIDNINQKIQWLYDFHHVFYDINAIPPARGNMQLAQAATTKILELFDVVCNENGLQYWLGAGNLLGIIRHDGKPISWDDDIDVYMLRSDYEKAMDLLPGIFKDSGLRLVFRGWSLKFICYKDFSLSFDIFPIDQYFQKPETEKEKTTLLKKINKLGKHATSREKWIKLWGYGSEKDWFNKVRHEDKQLLTPPKITARYNEEKLRWEKEIMQNKQPLFNGLLIKGFERYSWFDLDKGGTFWDYDWIFPLKRANYNGVDTYIPSNPELYLNAQYGDFYAFPSKFHIHTSRIKLPSSAFISANELIALDAVNFLNIRSVKNE